MAAWALMDDILDETQQPIASQRLAHAGTMVDTTTWIRVSVAPNQKPAFSNLQRQTLNPWREASRLGKPGGQ